MSQEWVQEAPFIKENKNFLLSCSHKRTHYCQPPSLFGALRSLLIYLSFAVFEEL